LAVAITMGTPWIGAKILRGNLVEARRAGMIIMLFLPKSEALHFGYRLCLRYYRA